MSDGEIVLYSTEDGLARVQLRAADGTVWLTQARMADLFQTSRPNITQHLTAIFESGECVEAAVCKQDLLTAADYDGKSETAQIFFAAVQNKMLHAVTGKTAGELIVARADPAAPNMGLRSWKGGKVRKGDVDTAKNYLEGRRSQRPQSYRDDVPRLCRGSGKTA